MCYSAADAKADEEESLNYCKAKIIDAYQMFKANLNRYTDEVTDEQAFNDFVNWIKMDVDVHTKWRVVFDTGKPYEESYDSDEALESGLRKFYEAHKYDEYPIDAKVYNIEGEDFSESQFVNEMIEGIIGDEDE